jgi:hypothetical protein
MTNPSKIAYLERIRKETSYPYLRGISNVIMYIMFAAACLVFIAGMMASAHNSLLLLAGGVGGAVIVSIAGIVIKEAMTVALDIADSITDLNYRYEGQQ